MNRVEQVYVFVTVVTGIVY